MKKTGFTAILLLLIIILNSCMLAVTPYESGTDDTKPEIPETESGTVTETGTDDKTTVLPRAYNADYYKFYDDIMINTLKEDGLSVVSPVNIYTCMSLLAQTAAGNTQKQMLDALGASDADDLAEKTKNIISSFYRDEEFMKTFSGNSLWLDDRLNVKEDCVNKLKKEYGAKIGEGSFKDQKFIDEMTKWLSDQTGGLLDGKINIEADDDTRAMLLSTLYLSARWRDEFYYDSSDKTRFNDNVYCNYMKNTENGRVYFGDNFTAYRKDMLDYKGAVWFFLPNEDSTVYDVIKSRPIEYIFNGEKKVKNGLEVHLTVPEFDVYSDGNLNGALSACGITEAFSETASFLPLSDDPLLIDAVSHAARVKVNWEGVEAAAYTGVTYAAAAADPQEEPEKYYFDLYRTFLFVITDRNDVPLFAGTVGDEDVIKLIG